MKELSDKDIIEYLYNCYAKVDGLWFVKTEEEYGFDKALALDAEVWKVMPKIQARFLKGKFLEKNAETPAEKHKKAHEKSTKDPVELFIKAIKIKMALDRFKFKILKKPGIINVEITECPWHNILIKSGRESLSGRIGSVICTTEYPAFAGEFIPGVVLELDSRICNKDKNCIFNFEIKTGSYEK